MRKESQYAKPIAFVSKKRYYCFMEDVQNKNCGAKNNHVRLSFRILWFLAALVSFAFTFIDHVKSLGGDGRPVALFFTSWSAWISFAAATASLAFEILQKAKGVQNAKTSDQTVLHSLLNFCAAIMMTATFLIAAFVLPDKIWTANYWTFGSTFKHFILPIFTIGDEILFPGKRKIFFPLLGMVIPISWCFIIMRRALSARAFFGGAIPQNLWGQYYPYGFTNLDNGRSLKGLCLLFLGIGIGLILFGFLFLFLEKLKSGKKSATAAA